MSNVHSGFELLRKLATPVMLFDPKTRVPSFCNKAFLSWFPEDRVLEPVLGLDRERVASATAERPVILPVTAVARRGRERAAQLAVWPTESQGAAVWVVEASDQRRAAEAKAMLDSFSAVIDRNNRDLARQKRSIEQLLHNMRQAVFAVDARGRVVEPVSAFATSLFGPQVVGRSLAELIFDDQTIEAAVRLETVISTSVGGDELQWELVMDELPERLTIDRPDGGPLHIRMTFNPIFDQAERIERLLVVVEDETKIRELVARVQEDSAQRQLELEVTQAFLDCDPAHVRDFLIDARRLVEEGTTTDSARERMRAVHTLKGNARALSLDGVASVAHEVETRERQAGQAAREAMGKLDEVLRVAERLSDRLSITSGGMAVDQHATLDAIAQALESEDIEAVVEGARQLLLQPLERAWVALPRSLVELAGELGKQVVVETPSSCALRAPPRVVARLRGAVTHLARNAVDHGIELPAERGAAGKEEVARIRLTLSTAPDWVTLALEDDGQGIDWARLEEKATASGLDVPDDGDLGPLLFHPGLSTRDEVTELSGRGVGLDAVQAEVRALGGEVEVKSTVGKGTTFLVRVPVTHFNVATPRVGERPSAAG